MPGLGQHFILFAEAGDETSAHHAFVWVKSFTFPFRPYVSQPQTQRIHALASNSDTSPSLQLLPIDSRPGEGLITTVPGSTPRQPCPVVLFTVNGPPDLTSVAFV
jgi:hypothetical protein